MAEREGEIIEWEREIFLIKLRMGPPTMSPLAPGEASHFGQSPLEPFRAEVLVGQVRLACRRVCSPPV